MENRILVIILCLCVNTHMISCQLPNPNMTGDVHYLNYMPATRSGADGLIKYGPATNNLNTTSHYRTSGRFEEFRHFGRKVNSNNNNQNALTAQASTNVKGISALKKYHNVPLVSEISTKKGFNNILLHSR